MLAPMKDHQLLNDFSTSLPWLQHRMPIFSAGLTRWSRQRLKRESLHAELIFADLREFEFPDTVDLLVASYINSSCDLKNMTKAQSQHKQSDFQFETRRCDSMNVKWQPLIDQAASCFYCFTINVLQVGHPWW